MVIRSPLRTIVPLALATGLVGCVYAPLDGQVVTSTTAPLSVSGLGGYPSDTVQLQVLSPFTLTWVTLDTETTSSSNGNPSGVQPLYAYGFDVVVPAAYWSNGPWSNKCATLRVTEANIPLATFGATGYPNPDLPPGEDVFDPHWNSGMDCLMHEWENNGHDWYLAGVECQSGDTFTVCTPAIIPPPR